MPAGHRPRPLVRHGARGVREGGARDRAHPSRSRAQRGGDLRALITAEAYPALRAAIDAGVFLSERDPFSFGFARILDGIEAYLVPSPRAEAPRACRRGRPDDADIAGDKRFREARKAVRDAERALRDARKLERQTARDARDVRRGSRAG